MYLLVPLMCFQLLIILADSVVCGLLECLAIMKWLTERGHQLIDYKLLNMYLHSPTKHLLNF